VAGARWEGVVTVLGGCVLRSDAMCCSVWQCVAVHGSVLQCVGSGGREVGGCCHGVEMLYVGSRRSEMRLQEVNRV